MGATKRFAKKMLKTTRLSMEERPHMTTTENPLKANPGDVSVPIDYFYLMSHTILVTVHRDLIQVW